MLCRKDDKMKIDSFLCLACNLKLDCDFLPGTRECRSMHGMAQQNDIEKNQDSTQQTNGDADAK